MSASFIYTPESKILARTIDDSGSSYELILLFPPGVVSSFPVVIRRFDIDFTGSVFEPCMYRNNLVYPPLFSRLLITGADTRDVYLERRFSECRYEPCASFTYQQTFILDQPFVIESPNAVVRFLFYNWFCPTQIVVSGIRIYYDRTGRRHRRKKQETTTIAPPLQTLPPATDNNTKDTTRQILSSPIFWVLICLIIVLIILLAMSQVA